jgi:hypothetical protein
MPTVTSSNIIVSQSWAGKRLTKALCARGGFHIEHQAKTQANKMVGSHRTEGRSNKTTPGGYAPGVLREPSDAPGNAATFMMSGIMFGSSVALRIADLTTASGTNDIGIRVPPSCARR